MLTFDTEVKQWCWLMIQTVYLFIYMGIFLVMLTSMPKNTKPEKYSVQFIYLNRDYQSIFFFIYNECKQSSTKANLNEVKVSRAVTLLEEEHSQRHVGIRLGVSQAVIWRLWQRYLMTGRLTRCTRYLNLTTR